MGRTPIKKLPPSSSIGLPGIPVPNRGSKKIDIGFGNLRTDSADAAWHADRTDGSASGPFARRTGSVRLLWSVTIPSDDVLLQNPFDFGDGRRICY